MSDLPVRVIVGENGAYWRDFGDFYSMCVVSTDNDPVVPVAVYERAPLSGADLRAACETYLRENGWTRRPHVADGWLHPVPRERPVIAHSLSEALTVQFKRDGIGGAT